MGIEDERWLHAFGYYLPVKPKQILTLKFPGGAHKQIKTSDVQTMTQMKQSMMTEGQHENMSTQDIANLLEYLSGLKKK